MNARKNAIDLITILSMRRSSYVRNARFERATFGMFQFLESDALPLRQPPSQTLDEVTKMDYKVSTVIAQLRRLSYGNGSGPHVRPRLASKPLCCTAQLIERGGIQPGPAVGRTSVQRCHWPCQVLEVRRYFASSFKAAQAGPSHAIHNVPGVLTIRRCPFSSP